MKTDSLKVRDSALIPFAVQGIYFPIEDSRRYSYARNLRVRKTLSDEHAFLATNIILVNCRKWHSSAAEVGQHKVL